MKGPPPKDPTLRQRRNRATTAATLPAEGHRRRVPPLPKHRKRWHAMTVAWWRDVWRSPMATEFAKADTHQLFVVAELLERFWRKPNAALAKEVRLAAQAFGLNPLDRRRLQWELPREEEPARVEAAPAEPTVDPRSILRAVK